MKKQETFKELLEKEIERLRKKREEQKGVV